ncbi:ATP-dependent DNA ligase [Candidatus Woesebacteria bacterium]|nr:ATP-dependent DNA ligase [Candidatus Woesebacteria bacterium]
MQFKNLSEYFKQIEETPSRLEMTRILASLFKELTPAEFKYAAYLLQGQVTPPYAPLNFGMAEKMVIRAVSSAMQVDAAHCLKEYQQIGDLGKLTEKLKKEQPSFEEREMSIKEVFDGLKTMATSNGPGSQDEKVRQLGALVRQLDPLSSRYIVRIPVGQMRLGFSDMTILDSLSWMMVENKSLRPVLQGAYHVHPDLGYIGQILKEKGIESIKEVEPQIFTPIIMMRAERLSSGSEIIDKIGECIIEPKFDGFRLQIHKKGAEVRLFTRGLEDATYMYPDIVEGVKSEISAHEAIFEGEAIGYVPSTNSFLPFQETVQRKRKHGIDEKALEIPLKLFSFDLLYCDGISFISTAYTERREKLLSIMKEESEASTHTILLAKSERVSEGHAIELMFDDAITKGLEGIVAKKLDGHYEPGARGWNWIKFKRSYSSKIEDTIDCLVLGFDYGKGKRAAFGIGAFLVGVYDEKEDVYVTLAKIGTGLKDDEWIELKEKSDILTVKELPVRYNVDKGMHCDVWISPEIVVEIKADEITRSPIHTAGRIMKPSKSGSSTEVDTPGYALRFPRLQRFRNDKTPEDITTLKEIESMFQDRTK